MNGKAHEALIALFNNYKEANKLSVDILNIIAFELGVDYNGSEGSKRDLIILISHHLNK